MSTFLGQLFWVLFWANQLQEILFLILWKNNFFWSKLFEQLFWVILLLKVLFWVNILFKVIFWGLFWVGLLFWGLFWVTFLLQTLFWVNLLKKLLKKVLKKVLKERSPQKSTQKSPFILLFWIQNLYHFVLLILNKVRLEFKHSVFKKDLHWVNGWWSLPHTAWNGFIF